MSRCQHGEAESTCHRCCEPPGLLRDQQARALKAETELAAARTAVRTVAHQVFEACVDAVAMSMITGEGWTVDVDAIVKRTIS